MVDQLITLCTCIFFF